MRRYDRFPDLTWRRGAAAGFVLVTCALAAMAGPGRMPGIAWPPAGVLLTLLLVAGYDAWLPGVAGIFVGARVAGEPAIVALVAAIAATAQACAGAWLVNRWTGGIASLGRTRAFARFVIVTGVLAAAVGPLVGYPALILIGRAPQLPAAAAALSWWLNDAVSTLVIAPAVVLWWQPPRAADPQRTLAEGGALAAATWLTWAALFGPWGRDLARYPVVVLCVPTLLWAAYRFGPRVAALAVAGLAIVVSAATRAGLGPFVTGSPLGSLAAADAFLGVCAVTTFALATVTRERRAAERQLMTLARTDALTGLANYRAFAEVLDAEVSRAARRGDTFAVLFVDLDGLKAINDTQGHLAGNRAILRVARALQVNCRTIDVAARMGGDEFCVLLPHTDGDAAAAVASRVRHSLRAGSVPPRVDVSWGVAEFPRDGATGEELLACADRLLYSEKSRRSASGRSPVAVPAAG
ncbi:MAG TPA: diguanylate cyclase [Gemmatimonadaceae bacterium]|nr:diguanylate cyclase [Gemmatimonadaceae bacterium]